MTVTTLSLPHGGYTATITFHDGRLLVQFPQFKTAAEAQAWGEQWLADAVRAYARQRAAAGAHLQAVG